MASKATALPAWLYPKKFRTLDRIRTCDPLLRRQLLYPAELPGHKKDSGMLYTGTSKR